jgi:hypothetical protein
MAQKDVQVKKRSLREYWSHFKAKKQGFRRRLNEILETARTYGFQFRDN